MLVLVDEIYLLFCEWACFAVICYLWAKNILVTNVFGWVTLTSAAKDNSLSQYPKRRSRERTLLDMVRPVKFHHKFRVHFLKLER